MLTKSACIKWLGNVWWAVTVVFYNWNNSALKQSFCSTDNPACFLNDLKCTWNTLEKSRIPPSNPWAREGWENSILWALDVFPFPRHRERSLVLSQPGGVVGEMSPLVFSTSPMSPLTANLINSTLIPTFCFCKPQRFQKSADLGAGRGALEDPVTPLIVK